MPEMKNTFNKKRERREVGGSKGRLIALLQGLFVTFLWSTSYVLVKTGLHTIPPLTFAAFRYVIASLVLLSAATLSQSKISTSVKEDLPRLVFLGFSGYSIAQGLQFVGLYYLPVVTVSFLLTFTPVMVLLLGIMILRELPSPLQLVGMILALLGGYLFFLAPISETGLIGGIITLLSGMGWAIYMIASRRILRRERPNTLNLTAVSMFIGAIPLLISALLIEGPPDMSFPELAIVLWLSLVNTAFAFVLWNNALERIRAFELSVFQNTMLIQTGVLAWMFLGEELSAAKIIAMGMVFVGVLMVQVAGRGLKWRKTS